MVLYLVVKTVVVLEIVVGTSFKIVFVEVYVTTVGTPLTVIVV